MGIENDEEGEPQTIAENALSAENCGNLIVHVLDLLHKPQLKILAGTFLQLWAFTVTPERILYGKKTFPH